MLFWLSVLGIVYAVLAVIIFIGSAIGEAGELPFWEVVGNAAGRAIFWPIVGFFYILGNSY